jgi:transposase InsO family protein
MKAAEEQIRILKNVVARLVLELEVKKRAFKKKSVPRAEAIEVVRRYRSHPLVGLRELLEWTSVPRSTFYHKRSNGRLGRRPSQVTSNIQGEVFDNMAVVGRMEGILQHEFCCYGYRNVWDCLREEGWIINQKKVYSLMKTHHLLFNRKIGRSGKPRQFVRFRKIVAVKPLEHLCMGIKYVHIHGARRNALLLTVMDVYSRKILIHMMWFNIKKGDVIVMLSLLLMEYKIHGMTIRNDNGSQFITGVVREYLHEKGISQEFTHVATPEENGYIEALHSNVQRELIERFEFESLHHGQLVFGRYYEWYNNVRKNGSLGRKPPEFVWKKSAVPVPYKNTDKLTLTT